jgi:hypothetical protein
MSEQKITQVEKTASELGISVSKIEAVENNDTVITVPSKKAKPKASAEPVVNDTIGSTIEKEQPKKQKVALYSSRNVFWEGVGEVQRGYNFVTPEQADRWVTRIHIRVATPEEIKEVFDN